ncbi:MAG: hypothetical protein D6805_05185 [Planctomycetota bacterium]|nr:MAG: hypothetical protein D6805_05185 [Planctomycetota bacterium]
MAKALAKHQDILKILQARFDSLPLELTSKIQFVGDVSKLEKGGRGSAFFEKGFLLRRIFCS